MAIFHLDIKTLSRSQGRSATAAAAYRSATRIVDERTGEVHDYSRRKGVVIAGVFLPKDAPAWATDSAALWNAAEKAEKRKDATVAREIIVALPAELAHDEFAQWRLVKKFTEELVSQHGFAAEVAIHSAGKGDERNWHAHILLSTRRMGPEGFTEKTRE